MRSITRRFLPVLAVLLLVAAVVQFGRQPRATSTEPAEITQPSPVPEVDEYGIEAGIYRTVEGRVRRHATFTDLLAPHAVPYPTIVRAAEQARPVFDVRRHLRAGRPYRLYLDDSLGTPRYLVYEQDAIHYVVFELGDSVRVYTRERPVTSVERTVRGVITRSLYETLAEQGVDPALAVELSEVYAWQIDFYRIQKNDAFTVIYEERQVDGQPVGIGAIRAARFTHAGRDYLAFRFEQDGHVDYFDEEGNSLRKAFLMSPVKYARISSRYNLRRFHPVQKRYKAHLGTDYAAPTGTPIRATGDGVVLEARYARYNGNYVKIRHNGTYTTGYLHMSRIAKGIRPGVRVRQGDIIGYVGSTGLATGPHVCYRFWKNGQQVNHLREEFPSSEPIRPAFRAAFEAYRDAMLPRLDLQRPLLAASSPGPPPTPRLPSPLAP
ncbi:MAG: peptidase M24 [Rhodothermaceae bacterium]|nr:MAG: peptidase M24 [Rhodothermaceae bacterium]